MRREETETDGKGRREGSSEGRRKGRIGSDEKASVEIGKAKGQKGGKKERKRRREDGRGI